MAEFILVTNQQYLLAEFKPLLPDASSLDIVAGANELAPLLAENPNKVVIVDSQIFASENKEELSNILGFYPELPIVGLIDTNNPDVSINSFHGFDVYRYLQSPLTAEKLQSCLNAASRKLNKTTIIEDETISTSDNKSKNYIYLTVVVFIIAIIALFTLGSEKRKDSQPVAKEKTIEVIKEASTSGKEILSIETQEKLIESSTLEETKNTELAELLEKAKNALDIDQLYEPEQNNALNYYLEILNIDNNNNEAQQGIKKIEHRLLSKLKLDLEKERFEDINKVYNKLFQLNSIHLNLSEHKNIIQKSIDSFLSNTDAAINSQDYNAAQAYLTNASQLSLTENLNIQALKDKLETSKSFAAQLATLKEQFNSSLTSKKLISPKNNNAVHFFEAINKISNNTSLLTELQNKLGSALAEQTNLFINKDLGRAKQHLSATEKYSNDKNAVALIKQRILQKDKSASTAKQISQTDKKLKDLIYLTNKAIEEDRLLYPQDNNAFYYLNQAKSIAPQNTEVLAKANVLVDLLLIQIRNDINENTLAAATSRLNKVKELRVKTNKISNVEKELKAAIQRQSQ